MTGGVRSGLFLGLNKNAVSFSAVSGALMQFTVARVAGDLAQISWPLYLEHSMQDIIFNWVRGDDEAETFVFTEDNGEPLDFTGSRFDCDIVPLGSARRI